MRNTAIRNTPYLCEKMQAAEKDSQNHLRETSHPACSAQTHISTVGYTARVRASSLKCVVKKTKAWTRRPFSWVQVLDRQANSHFAANQGFGDCMSETDTFDRGCTSTELQVNINGISWPNMIPVLRAPPTHLIDQHKRILCHQSQDHARGSHLRGERREGLFDGICR
jgi:hypothetical protein